MDSLKLREAEVRRQAELDKQMLAMERERVKLKEEQLVAREENLKQMANEKAQKWVRIALSRATPSILVKN